MPRVETTGDYATEWGAARAYFMEANRLLYDFMLARRYETFEDLVVGDRKLARDEKEAVAVLAARGLAHARQALRLRRGGLEGLLYYALNLAMGTVSKGKARAFLEGLPRKLRRAWGKVIQRDRTFAAGGALRLKARFLTIAPWPYRDHEEAVKALEEARDIAGVPQTFLHLGDTYYLTGRKEDARAAWKRCLELPSHPTTEPLYERVQDLARQRLRCVLPSHTAARK